MCKESVIKLLSLITHKSSTTEPHLNNEKKLWETRLLVFKPSWEIQYNGQGHAPKKYHMNKSNIQSMNHLIFIDCKPCFSHESWLGRISPLPSS